MLKGISLKISFRKKVNLGFFISVILILLFAFYASNIAEELKKVKEINLKTFRIIEELNELIVLSRELEIQRRDYLLTKNVMYLESYYLTLIKIQTELSKLEQDKYFVSKEKSRDKFNFVKELISKNLDCSLDCKYNPELKKPIHHVVKNHFLSSEIETFSEDIQNNIEEVISEERFYLEEGQDKASTYTWMIDFLIISGSGFAILILLILIYFVNRDIILDRLHIAELRALSITDELTGLNNRRGFIYESKHKFQEAVENKRRMFLYFIDMDGLKLINDTLGHEYGDKAIKAMSEILKQSFRLSDVIARLGGDEFAVLMVDEHVTPETIQQRLQKKITEYNETSGQPFKLAMSLGFKEFNPNSPTSIEEMLHEADKKMYQDKQARKKRT